MTVDRDSKPPPVATATEDAGARERHRAPALGIPIGMTPTPTEVLRHELADVREDLARLRNDHTTAVTDLRGQHGDNGKVGELRRRLDTLSSRAWWLLTLAIGSIGAAALKLVAVTTAFNHVAERSAHSADQLRILQAQVLTIQSALLVRDLVPAPEPGKDPQP